MSKWILIVIAGLLGTASGLGAYTFITAKGYSYLTNDAAACANCHVMREHFSAWEKSSHRKVAVCNDCHAPHDNVVHKYAVKGENGFWHSLNFTTGRHPDPLRIRAKNRRVTQEACLSCHGDLAKGITPSGHAGTGPDEIDCIQCHRYVGHWVR
jgi:cytochrome c nitrite reductase small subunit